MQLLNKKALAFFIIELVIAIVALFVVIKVVAPAISAFISTNNNDVKSFKHFVAELEAINPGEETVLKFPSIKDKSLLVFIAYPREEINLPLENGLIDPPLSTSFVVRDYLNSNNDFHRWNTRTVTIPPQCEEHCICYCSGEKNAKDISCGEDLICTELSCNKPFTCLSVSFQIPSQVNGDYLEDSSNDLYRFSETAIHFYNGYFFEPYGEIDTPSYEAHARKDMQGKLDLCLGKDCFTQRRELVP